MNRIFIFILMLNSLPSAAQNNSALTQKTAIEVRQGISAVFVSPIVSISLKVPVVPPTITQAKDYLLWYKGKKIDDSTLITPQATVVRWSKPRDIVIVQLKKDPFVKMAAKLSTTQTRKDQLYTKMAERKTSVMLYPSLMATFNEFDAIDETYTNALKNTINLPPVLQGTAFQQSRFKTGGTASLKFVLTSIPAHIKKAYDEVMTSMKNYPPIDFPPPPDMDFGTCTSYECDSMAYQQLIAKRKSWQDDFTQYEAEIIRKSVAIQKTIQLTLVSADDAELKTIEAGLGRAMDFASARIKNKIDLLVRKYGNEFTKLPAVAAVVISAERQRQLTGATDDMSSGPVIAKLSEQLSGVEKYLEQQMDAKNYSVALNMAFILGMVRQRQLLGAAEEDNRMNAIIDKFNAYNRFKINVTLEFSAIEENECGNSTDNVSATNDVDYYVSVVPSNCKFIFIQHEQHIAVAPNHLFGLAQPIDLKTGAGKRVDKLTDPNDSEKCITEPKAYSNLLVRIGLPFARLSFCENAEEDTLFASELEMHERGSRRGPSKIYGYYPYPEDDEYVNPLEEEEELKNIFEEYILTVPKSQRMLSLEETRKYQQSAEKFLAIALREKVMEQRKTPFFTFDAKNGDPTIIDGSTTLITEDKNYKEDWGYEKKTTTNFKVKVVHDPLPYKKQ